MKWSRNTSERNMMLCTIWYHLYNLKNLKNIRGGVTPIHLHGCFFFFFKFYKWYQIEQIVSNNFSKYKECAFPNASSIEHFWILSPHHGRASSVCKPATH